MGCVLFISEQERNDALEKYESGAKLIRGFASGLIPLINGTYIAITCLASHNYYQVSGNTIEELPNTAQDVEYLDKVVHDYGIPEGKMQTDDVFIINTIIRKGKTAAIKEASIKTEIKYVNRATLIQNNPIIFNNNGYVLFTSYNDAELFIRQFGNVSNYLIQVALYATRDKQKMQIEELNKQAKNDKKGMVQMFTLMGGTSIGSILIDNIIKAAKEGEAGDETVRKLLKIALIGALGVGSVIGIYMLYKKLASWNENKKK
jgi:hypothetical protein